MDTMIIMETLDGPVIEGSLPPLPPPTADDLAAVAAVIAKYASNERHGTHNQKDHGRKGAGSTKGLHEPDGGFTIDTGGRAVRTGWSVAIAGTSKFMSAEEFNTDDAAAKEFVSGFLRDARGQGVKSIGGWHDPDPDTPGKAIVLDHVRIFPKEQHDLARAFAVANNQKSMANLDAITAGDWDNAIEQTGGTGDRSALLAAAAAHGRIPVHGQDPADPGGVRHPAGRDDRRADRHPVGGDRGRHAGEPGFVDLATKYGLTLRHPGHPDQKVHGRRGISPVKGHLVDGETQRDLTMGAFPQETQDAVNARMLKSLGVTPEEAEAHLVEMAEVGLANGLPGKDWYQGAHDEAVALAEKNGIDPEVGVAITAALSPGTPWGQNQANAAAMMNVYGKRHLPIDSAQVDKVNEWAAKVDKTTGKPNSEMRIKPGDTLDDIYARDPHLAGVYMAKAGNASVGYSYDNFFKATELMYKNDPASINGILEGAKVRSFHNNILNPMNSVDVTVDIHMQRAMSSGTTTSPQDQYDRFTSIKKDSSAITGTPSFEGAGIGAMPAMADAVRRATDTFNASHPELPDLLPSQFQAVVWTAQITTYPDSRTKSILKGGEL